MVSLLISLKNILFGSLFNVTRDSGKASSDQTMKTICQNILLWGAAALALSGCSIVVFEDGPKCPPEAPCPVAIISSDEFFDSAPSPEISAEEPAVIEPEPSLPASEAVTAPPLVDGYITNFAYDSAVLDKAALAGLVFVADYLKSDKNNTILVEGHCDERGTRDYNLALGEKRAAAVRDALVRLGVAKGRIRIISYGKERPADRGTTEAAWAKNRRTVIRLDPS